jgi:hypothetical protein
MVFALYRKNYVCSLWELETHKIMCQIERDR